jgi:uncharacterized membrane protein
VAVLKASDRPMSDFQQLPMVEQRSIKQRLIKYGKLYVLASLSFKVILLALMLTGFPCIELALETVESAIIRK